MGAQGGDEVKGVEALGKYFVEYQQGGAVVFCKEGVGEAEAVFVVQHVEVADDILVLYVRAAEGDGLVEDGEGVTHGAVGFLGYDVQGGVVCRNAFFICDCAEVADYVRYADAVEVVCLAAAEDGGDDLVLLCCAEDEDGVCRGFLKRFEEGVERGLREHMDLVYDVHAVAAHLGRYLHLLHEGFDVFYAVV